MNQPRMSHHNVVLRRLTPVPSCPALLARPPTIVGSAHSGGGQAVADLLRTIICGHVGMVKVAHSRSRTLTQAKLTLLFK